MWDKSTSWGGKKTIKRRNGGIVGSADHHPSRLTFCGGGSDHAWWWWFSYSFPSDDDHYHPAILSSALKLALVILEVTYFHPLLFLSLRIKCCVKILVFFSTSRETKIDKRIGYKSSLSHITTADAEQCEVLWRIKSGGHEIMSWYMRRHHHLLFTDDHVINEEKA